MKDYGLAENTLKCGVYKMDCASIHEIEKLFLALEKLDSRVAKVLLDRSGCICKIKYCTDEVIRIIKILDKKDDRVENIEFTEIVSILRDMLESIVLLEIYGEDYILNGTSKERENLLIKIGEVGILTRILARRYNMLCRRNNTSS